MPGTSQTVRLALQLSGEAQMRRPLDAAALTVQMAARSMRQNVQKAPVAMFAVQIPAEVFLDDSHAATLTDKGQWLAQWSAISARGLLIDRFRAAECRCTLRAH